MWTRDPKMCHCHRHCVCPLWRRCAARDRGRSLHRKWFSSGSSVGLTSGKGNGFMAISIVEPRKMKRCKWSTSHHIGDLVAGEGIFGLILVLYLSLLNCMGLGETKPNGILYTGLSEYSTHSNQIPSHVWQIYIYKHKYINHFPFKRPPVWVPPPVPNRWPVGMRNCRWTRCVEDRKEDREWITHDRRSWEQSLNCRKMAW